MPSAHSALAPDRKETLRKALLNAGKALGLPQAELAVVVGRDRSALHRGIEPDSKPGELALLLIRAYRSLYVLIGGNPEEMRHWMHTENLHTGGVPAQQIQSVQGLVRVVEYLDAMRGKV